MAQLAIAGIAAIAGDALITAPVLGLSGAGIGWAVGSALASYLLKPEHEKPPVGDLTAPDLQYGASLPRIWGTVATGGWLAWMSTKRATEETTEVGKGGSDTVTTGYSYSADMMFIVASESGDDVKLLRVWRNGKPVYSQVAGADPATYTQSASTDTWDAIEIRDGNSTQTPWPIYEAAVGTADAIAYRRRTAICITNARFGNSPSPPAYLFEIATSTAISGYQLSLGDVAPGGIYYAMGGLAATSNGARLWMGEWDATQAQRSFDVVESTGGVPSVLVDGIGFSGSSGSAGVLCLGSANTDVPFAVVQIGYPGSDVYLFVTESGTSSTATPVAPAVFEYGVWCKLGSDVYIGCSQLGSQLIEQYTSTGTYVGATSTFAYVKSIAATPTKVYALQAGASSTIYTFDASTLSSLASITAPETNSVAKILTQSETLYYLSEDKLYQWTGTSWTTLATGLTGGAGAQGSGGTSYKHCISNGALWTVRFTAPTAPSTLSWYRVPFALSGLPVNLEDVVRDICLSCPPLTSSLIATSALSSATVRGFASSGSPRQALEQLAAAFFFSSHGTDVLNFILRGGASLFTIPFEDLGAGVDNPVEEPLSISRGNNNEIPRKLALKYTNWNSDHEPGSVTGDRGDGPATQVETTEVSLVLTPDEAQKIADAWAMDRRTAATTLRPSVTDHYLELTPTDVVTLTDSDGTTYRVRIVADDYVNGVHSYECVLDDASIFSQPGIATDYTTPTTSIPLNSDTTLYLMDIPSLRDADLYDDGYYLAVARSTITGSWIGANVSRSLDDATYTSVISVTSEAGLGVTTTVLGDWSGGNVMDHTNKVTVSINGAAPTFTDDQVLAGTDLVWLIGDELIEARTATMVSPGIYTLSNLLRGRLGTEDAMGTHVAGEHVVAIETARLRRIAGDASQIGVQYYYRAPSYGRSLSTASTQTFTNTGRSIKPLSAASVEIERDGSNNASITVYRRTRKRHRFLAPGIQPPLGETVEAYEADVYSDGTYTTVVRTLSALGTNVLTYSAANQSSDGLTPGDTLYLAVYQMSTVIGRGIEKRISA